MKGKYIFSQEDIDFLQSQNNSPNPEWNIFVTAQHGYVRNLDHDILQHLENTYKRTINPAFVLCFHCSSEVLKMIKELQQAYAAQMEEQAAIASHAEIVAMEQAAADRTEQNPPTEPAAATLPEAPADPAATDTPAAPADAPAPAATEAAPPPPPPPPVAPKTPKAPKEQGK